MISLLISNAAFEGVTFLAEVIKLIAWFFVVKYGVYFAIKKAKKEKLL